MIPWYCCRKHHPSFLQIGKILSVSPMRSQFSCKFLSKGDIYAVCDHFRQEITGHRRSPFYHIDPFVTIIFLGRTARISIDSV
ncbi:hypothetical protein [Nostoc sp.]|uniref:hypothetical protein n=1 Tax=Nostoc sp. TaxID=1180 RepID=UPI002FF902AD